MRIKLDKVHVSTFANGSDYAELWFCLYFIDEANSALIRVVVLFEVFEMYTSL